MFHHTSTCETLAVLLMKTYPLTYPQVMYYNRRTTSVVQGENNNE